MSSSGLLYAIAGLPLRLDFGGSDFGGSDFARESFGCPDVEEAFDGALAGDELAVAGIYVAGEEIRAVSIGARHESCNFSLSVSSGDCPPASRIPSA